MGEEVAVFDHGQFELDEVSSDGAKITVKEIKISHDNIIAYIHENIRIDDVFDDEDIKGYIVYTWHPQQVFSDAELGMWAKKNGFIMESE